MGFQELERYYFFNPKLARFYMRSVQFSFWSLAPVPQIIQKIPGNYWPCLYLSVDKWLNQLWFKRYIQKCTTSCTNNHHDATDLVNHEMVKITKTWISWEQNIIFLQKIKKFLACASDNPFAEVIVL